MSFAPAGGVAGEPVFRQRGEAVGRFIPGWRWRLCVPSKFAVTPACRSKLLGKFVPVSSGELNQFALVLLGCIFCIKSKHWRKSEISDR